MITNKKFMTTALAAVLAVSTLPVSAFATGESTVTPPAAAVTAPKATTNAQDTSKPAAEKDYQGMASATVEIGNSVKNSDIQFFPALPEGASVERIAYGEINKIGRYDAKVTVKLKDGTLKDIDLLITVTEKQDPAKGEAKEFVPKIKEILASRNENIDIKTAITNLPPGAKVTLITDVNTRELGNMIGSVLVTFADGSQKKVQIPVQVVEDKTAIEILFDPMGGKVTELARKATAGKAIGELPVPTKEGYTFEGWYREKDWKEKVTKDSTFEKSATLYAKYTQGVTNGTEVKRNAYIFGYPDGTFRPQGNVTRAEAAQMFATLLNGSNNFVTSKTTKFSDANGAWYSQAVNYVVDKKLISGYSDGTFRPGNNITRAEFAQMISGMLDNKEKAQTTLKDVQGHWAQDAIAKVYGAKKVTGYPDGTFRPNKDITRAEAVTIFNALFDRKTTKESLKNVNLTNVTKFKDLPESHWAYYQITDASNGHTSTVGADGIEIWK